VRNHPPRHGLLPSQQGDGGVPRRPAQVTRRPPSRTGRLLRRRGFTLLELTVALGVFVVFSVALTSVTTSSLNTQAQLRAASNATVALERAADRVIDATGFAALAAGEILVPDDQRSVCLDDNGDADQNCPLPPRQRQLLEDCMASLDDPRQGCVLSGQSALLVTYSVEPRLGALLAQPGMQEAYLARLFAFTQLPNGKQLTVTRTAGTPAGAAASAYGYVRVVLPELPDDLFTQVILKDGELKMFVPRARLVSESDGGAGPGGGGQMTEVISWTALSGDTLVLQVENPGEVCTRAAPCRVELDGGRYSLSDRYTARGGNQVIVSAGQVMPVALQLTSGPSALIRLDTLPERASTLRGAPPRGSVCLWGVFTVAGEERAEVWCNNTSATEVLVRGWSDDGTERDLPAGDLALSANPPSTVTVTDPNNPGATIDVPDCASTGLTLTGTVVWDGSGWQNGVTCTGWTWGQPGVLAASVFSRQSFVEGATTIALQPSLRRELTLYWTPQGGVPAAGCSAADPSWALPRRAGSRPTTWRADQQSAGGCGETADQLRQAPQWVTTTLPQMTLGAPYTTRLVADATPAATFRVVSGDLPCRAGARHRHRAPRRHPTDDRAVGVRGRRREPGRVGSPDLRRQRRRWLIPPAGPCDPPPHRLSP
jgi:prepilin-type N-terminal cleavage/methylation domain-containing protein